MSSLYKHLKFSDPAKQIRLLRLEPSPTGTDEYAFSLEVHDFQENSRPSYIAISYTWGLPIPKLPVVINGFRIEVQFNCWYALWQMRHHGYTSDVNFWIDSLCINQGHDDEKGYQVAMMGDIFPSASLVAASLGNGESLGNVREILASGDILEIKKLGNRFAQLPYFDRVWIKQEIVLAKDISIFYGLERLSWGQFDQAFNDTKTNLWNSQNDNTGSITRSSQYQYDHSSSFSHQKHENPQGQYVSIQQLCNHRSEVTKTSTLMDLVARYGNAKASVAADKIYALLPLLSQSDPIRRELPVTYGEATCFPLFRTLVRLLYSHYQDQDVGDKHSALCIIRDSLGICDLDEDVSAFLGPQAGYPLDARSFHEKSVTLKIWCLHVLKDEKSRELNAKDLRVNMKQTEPPGAVRKLGLSGHDGNTDHINRPRGPTDRDSYGILPELHIPLQLKSLRTLYNLMGPRPSRLLEPALRERFLVSSDVRPGDLLGTLVWGESRYNTKRPWDLAHIILRRTTFADEGKSQDYDVPFEEETKRCRTAFFLHSWAIPIRRECTMLADLNSLHPFIHVPETHVRINDIGSARLRLHYRDALVPLLLNYHPLQSLLYSKRALDPGAINLFSQVENPENIVERLEEGCDFRRQAYWCLGWRK